jgi:hypothetical protein
LVIRSGFIVVVIPTKIMAKPIKIRTCNITVSLDVKLRLSGNCESADRGRSQQRLRSTPALCRARQPRSPLGYDFGMELGSRSFGTKRSGVSCRCGSRGWHRIHKAFVRNMCRGKRLTKRRPSTLSNALAGNRMPFSVLSSRWMMNLLMSAFGTKRTLSPRRTMSAFGGKADISGT